MSGDAFWHVLAGAALVYCGILTFVLVAVMRQVGSLLLLINPDFPREVPGGPDLDQEVDVPGLAAAPAVVLFVAPGCAACEDLMPTIPNVVRAFPDVAVVAAVGQADTPAGRELVAELGAAARADLSTLQEDWDVPGTPFGVAVSADRRVAGRGIVNTLDQLTTLAELARDGRPAADPHEAGHEARDGDGEHAEHREEAGLVASGSTS